MKFDSSAKYQDSHEWARKENDLIIIGISDYAQDSLSDVVFVELPQVGDTFKKGEEFGTIESVKAANELLIPMSGEVVEINEALEDESELVNEDPFGEGWIIKISPSDSSEWDDLMTLDEYKKSIE
ncbi:MAG: glycine cleavage system protein H, partial [Anaerolineaceae bacterium 4572_78]